MAGDGATQEAVAGDDQGAGIQSDTLILDVGAGKDSVARQMWGAEKNVTITTLDIRKDVGADVVGDISAALPASLMGKFDIVLAHHVLEHVQLAATPRAIANMAMALKPGGKLHLYVPSLEWAAGQILDEEKPSEVLLYHLYGSQENPAMFHKSGFTIPLLRPLLEKAGLAVRQARIEPYEISVQTRAEPKPVAHKAAQIHLMGVKGGSTS
jgi:predicted SAM-dependent methyltransferase